jgi:hypothetical protein
MLVDDYFLSIHTLLEQSPIVLSSCLTFDKRSQSIGFIRGDIYLLDGSLLHVREFMAVQQTIDRYMYVYHYQDANGMLLFRYDNTPHFPDIPTFPHHKHAGSESSVIAANAPDLPAVLLEIAGRIGGEC